MKKILLLLTIIFLFIINKSTCQQTITDLDKLSWLQGNWKRTNAKAGRSGSEHWEKISAKEWKGTGITMKGIDTSVVEKMRLTLKDDGLYFVADVPGNNGSVFFKVTQLDEKGFTCENPVHDFPKKIEYSITGKLLKATISGNGKSIDYLFEKQ